LISSEAQTLHTFFEKERYFDKHYNFLEKTSDMKMLRRFIHLKFAAGQKMRPLQNAPFCPISALGSNLNPQNTQCIPVVKIFACLKLEQN